MSGSIELDITMERLAERLSTLSWYPRPPAAPIPSNTIPMEESQPAGRISPGGTA